LIADELEAMFASKKNAHHKLKDWKRSGIRRDSSSEDDVGPQLPSAKYVGHNEPKLTREEEAERQVTQR